MLPRKRTLPHPAYWLAPLAMLGATLLAVLFVRGQPLGVLGWVLAALFAVPFLWVLVSALWPARADRSCPSCGTDALERLDRATTYGLVCRSCGWRDETTSSWLLAEEEGPLEDVVLHQRGRKPERERNRSRSAVDTTPGAD